MKKILLLEYKRLFKNKILYLAIGIEIVVILLQICSEIIPYANGEIFMAVYPLTVFEKWLGGERSSVYPTLYFMLTPLIAAIPYGGSLQEDLRTGYIKNICTRTSKKNYFKAKYIVTFSTGLISVIPIVLNFLFVCLLLPALVPQASTSFYSINASSLFGELFYTHPMVYVGMWMLFDIIFYGLLATISLFSVFFSEYVYVSVLAPFLCCMILYGISLISNMATVAPFYFLNPSQIYPADYKVILLEMILLVLIGAGYYYVSCKKEIY